MALFMVGYDLKKPGQDYSSLIAALQTYDNWWHHLDSTWIIQSTHSAVQVRDYLRQFIDSNDELLVASISAPAAWVGFSDRGSTWLKNQL